ncbi:hypothetical protein BDU57DRAFT_561102 [Ampelomyces quisqualis]|uniref:LCCL domain-containing protein n=1 Tax=Ampelomyces quisqualis TaxID=50730 RepID=A0A6A5QXR4_AMPQU|nr:hypothetical protein BDU57DRAFT_561102 [Ampelomyces quisqualis]
MPHVPSLAPQCTRNFSSYHGSPLHHDTAVGPPHRSRASRTWHNVVATLPPPVVRWKKKVATWIKGPEPPQINHIVPLFERVQTLLVRMLGRMLPRWARVGVYACACVLWAVAFGVIISNYSLPANLGGFGAPVALSCTTSLWPSPQSCGPDGRNCFPFANSSFAFQCPANCLGVQVLNPKPIGNTSIIYRPLVVGGGEAEEEGGARVYRGDSFICGAAIHAGAITDGGGGCGVVSLVGEKSNFPAVSSNGINSVAYGSSFPMAIGFVQSDGIASDSGKCRDPRWNLLILSTSMSVVFSLFTSSPATFFAPVFTIMFFQVSMASDPPDYTNYPSLAATSLGRFLPAALIAALFYQFSVRKTLLNCKAHVEKTILWVGSAWVGSLSNYTLDKIPIQRLTGHDIRQQPGAITALVIIVLILLLLILFQAWCLRLEGRLGRFLALYAVFGISLGVLSAMPRLTLRIHHYILALLLLPGTSMQTRISMIAQGLLVGLFINGIARWNFDPILQTAAQLRGDAQLGSGVPSVLDPVIDGSNITFMWEGLLRGYDGVSVIVNDVERFRGLGWESEFTWTRREKGDLPEFFRFGFVNHMPFGRVGYSDFTRAGTWWANGSWSGIPAGRT